MANISRENLSKNHDKLNVTVDSADFLPQYDKTIKEYAKKAQIPGFRKGNVPVGLVKKMYGKDILSDDLMRVAGTEADKYIRENDVKIFAQPMLSEFPEITFENNTPSESYTFGFEIALIPEFDIPFLSKSESLTKLHVDATVDMVDEEVKRLQTRLGEMTNPDTITDDNTVLNVTIIECDENGKNIEGYTPIENSFLLSYIDENSRNLFLNKKLNDIVLAKFKDVFGDKLNKTMSKDLNLDVENEADQNKFFNFEITKIGFVKPADLNEEFFKKIVPNQDIKTEEEFKDFLKNDIQNQWDEASNNVLENTIFEDLVHTTPIDLPTEFLKKWLKYRDNGKPMTDEEVENEYPSFTHQMNWSLISDKIITDNNITVSPEEIKEVIGNNIKKYFGLPSTSQEEWLDGYINKMAEDRKEYEKTANEIMAKKVLGFAASKVNITNKTVTKEEFNELADVNKYHEHTH